MKFFTPVVTNEYQQRLTVLADRLDVYTRKYEAAKDSRAIFSCTYTNITLVLANGLTDETFRDPQWIVSLAEIFAGYYFRALDAEDEKREVPAAWKKVFDTIRFNNSSVLEDMVFAMTAHIVHDLPFALVDAGRTNEDETSHIHDFHQMNDILAANVQVIEDAVLSRYAPFLSWLDHLEKGYDQILSNYGFRLSRGMAWYNADRLLDPHSKAEAERSIIRSVEIFIDNVRRPSILSVRIFFWFARFIVGLCRRWPKN